MIDILERKLCISSNTSESAVGEETVLLHLEKGIFFGLDAVGTRIWAMMKEGMAPAEICEILSTEYGVQRDIIDADARQFLSDLHAHGMIVDA